MGLPLSLRLMPMPTTATAMVVATTVATTESVRLRLSPTTVSTLPTTLLPLLLATPPCRRCPCCLPRRPCCCPSCLQLRPGLTLRLPLHRWHCPRCHPCCWRSLRWCRTLRRQLRRNRPCCQEGGLGRPLLLRRIPRSWLQDLRIRTWSRLRLRSRLRLLWLDSAWMS